MPKVNPPPDAIGPVPPAGQHGIGLKGSLIFYKWRGKPCVRSWPKKRTKKQLQKMQEQMDTFSALVWGSTAQVGEMQIAAASMSKGTVLYPRDISMMAMNTTAFGALSLNLMPDESTPPQNFRTERRSAKTMSQTPPNEPTGTTIRLYAMSDAITVSSWLDALGYQPGSLLIRYEDIWHALKAGEAGQTLTIDKDTLSPTWKQQGGGGGTANSFTTGLDTTTTSSSPNNIKGNVFKTSASITISAIELGVTKSTVQQYQLALCKLSASSGTPTITEVHLTNTITAQDTSATKAMLRATLQEPVNFIDGDTGYICIFAKGAIATNATPATVIDTTRTAVPQGLLNFITGATLPETTPTVGASISIPSPLVGIFNCSLFSN